MYFSLKWKIFILCQRFRGEPWPYLSPLCVSPCTFFSPDEGSSYLVSTRNNCWSIMFICIVSLIKCTIFVISIYVFESLGFFFFFFRSDKWAAVTQTKWVISSTPAQHCVRYRVCENHFVENYFMSFTKLRLQFPLSVSLIATYF